MDRMIGGCVCLIHFNQARVANSSQAESPDVSEVGTLSSFMFVTGGSAPFGPTIVAKYNEMKFQVWFGIYSKAAPSELEFQIGQQHESVVESKVGKPKPEKPFKLESVFKLWTVMDVETWWLTISDFLKSAPRYKKSEAEVKAAEENYHLRLDGG